MSRPPKLRCAIYTRKSSDEGLEQSFNSLHAQREACEAYVKSQQHEGWTLVKTAYDDGGFSGGSMDRPGLKALMADVEAGRIDVVVVYKVDRLTRSLMDFSRIVERFDARGVSFVSVTQAFNTTTSMGRLTLNVLLSFAQFEREVTGERIRDKIKASKAKGMWMGGVVPLGYDAKDRTLVPNAPEADVVRGIFSRYLELGSVALLERDLAERGVRSKERRLKNGESAGGKVFSRGQLYALLRNPIYVGEIRHKTDRYPGLHPPIIDRDLFDQVQERLTRTREARASKIPAAGTSMLKGLLFDAEGAPMSPASSRGRGGRLHRYYVSSSLLRGKAGKPDGVLRRIAAKPLEALVLDRVQRLSPGAQLCADLLSRIVLRTHAIDIHLHRRAGMDWTEFARSLEPDDKFENLGNQGMILTVEIRSIRRGGRTWLVTPQGQHAAPARRHDPALIKALHLGHHRLREVGASPLTAATKLFQPKGIADRYAVHISRLAFLAPDIQAAILEGRQPPGLTLQSFVGTEVPLSWAEQRQVFGFPAIQCDH